MNIKYSTTCLIISILLCHATMIAQNDTIYYNQDWDETTKSNASFYRPMPLKKDGDKELIKDYYMNGTLQFEAWSKNVENGSEYDGNVVWYYANGAKSSEENYKNGERNGADISYYENGAIKNMLQMVDGRRQSSKSYSKEGKLLRSLTYKSGSPQEGIDECFTEYKDGRRIGKQLYYENTNILAYERICPDNGCYNESTETFYDKAGKVLQKNDCMDEEVIAGKEITFFKGADCGYVKAIKTSTGIENGDFNGEYKRYDVTGKTLYVGTYKQHAPYEGTFETTEDWLTYVTVYKKGRKSGKEIVFNKEKKIAEGFYEDDVKQNGSFVEERQFTGWSKTPIILNLKEGKEEGKQIFYNVARDITMGFYHAKGGIKDGAYAVMDYDGEIRAEATYKEGKPFDGAVLSNDEYRFYKNGERLRENVVIDIVEQERMEAFSKGSDTIEGGYNMGGFEMASSIAFLDTHQFFFSLSVGSLDLTTYGAYHLKNGTLKIQVPEEQKQSFVVYGGNDAMLKDSIEINYYNYNARSKPLLQLNKQWVSLEDLNQLEGEGSRRTNGIFKIKLKKLSALKLGIKNSNSANLVLQNILEADELKEYNRFVIAYNVSNREIMQMENATFTFNGENLVSDGNEKQKRPLTEKAKENILDYIIENRAFPNTIKSGSYEKIKMNSKESHLKIKKHTQLIPIEE